MSLRMLYLTRHGLSTPGTTLPDGNDDGPLTPLGEEQARLLGQRLVGAGITEVHHSTLRRAAAPPRSSAGPTCRRFFSTVPGKPGPRSRATPTDPGTPASCSSATGT
ncbi:MAG: histidine phosphatase family protein [Geodermatophilaceae bacterium]|nr:histidine phosphatase family protein [Geodermatophilaceae bacterium]